MDDRLRKKLDAQLKRAVDNLEKREQANLPACVPNVTYTRVSAAVIRRRPLLGQAVDGKY